MTTVIVYQNGISKEYKDVILIKAKEYVEFDTRMNHTVITNQPYIVIKTNE